MLISSLLGKLVLHMRLHFLDSAAYIRFELRFFFGLFRLRFERYMEKNDLWAWSAFLENDPLLRALRPKGKKKHRKKPLLRPWDGARVASLSLYALCGVENEAFIATMLAGTAQAALCALCACYGIPSEIQVRPDFSASTCRLNLESILELRPGQIIAAACRRQILRIRGKRYAASD